MAMAAPRRLATAHAGREEAVGVEVRARDARLGDHAVERGLLQPQGLGLGSGLGSGLGLELGLGLC